MTLKANFADQDIAMLGMGLMTPGGKIRPLIFSFVPTESAEAYKLCWIAFDCSAISFATKFQPFQRNKRLAVDVVTSDNSAAFKKFAMETKGISSMKCAAHLTGNKHFH